MADQVANKKTSLSSEEVLSRSVQFFSTEKWRVTSQAARTATFQGMPPIPWVHLLFTIIGLLACLVPGIILYILLIKKARRFVNLVVTANPLPKGSEVSISYPDNAKKLVNRFLDALPILIEKE